MQSREPCSTLAMVDYAWNPKQEFEEHLCSPSDTQHYIDVIAGPGGAKKK